MDINRETAFKQAVDDAWRRHGFRNYREAEDITMVERTAIYRMRNGQIPSRGKIIQWAEGLGESINHWLELAGYEPIRAELVDECGLSSDPVQRVAVALNGMRDLSDLSKQQILEFVKREMEKK
jgi:hypothetical protein